MPIMELYERTREDVLQQRLPGTYTKSRPSQAYKTILVLGIANLIMCGYTLFIYFGLNTVTVPYSTSTQSTVFLPKGTSYIYLGFDGVYQNLLSYTKSINYSQLKGNTTNLNLSNTKPFDMKDGLVYYPAGAIAATYPQDELILDNLEIKSEDIARNSELNAIGITDYTPGQIAIPENWTDKTNINTYPLNVAEETTGLPILNERFVNWINLAAFSDFKKLWGIVEVEQAGNYNLSILSPETIAENKKVIISEKSILGIPNYWAVIGLFSIGILSIGYSIYLRNYEY